MPIGASQLAGLINLAYAYPKSLTKTGIYNAGPCEIIDSQKRSNFIGSLVKRGLIQARLDNTIIDEKGSDPMLESDYHPHWDLTLLGWYHLLRVDKNKKMWYGAAVKLWLGYKEYLLANLTEEISIRLMGFTPPQRSSPYQVSQN